ncbi:hypothetical protein AYL99_11751 [Fonsecaea erecta]|uniref:Uncharacterized protein n=1 Tax=Fonsecaea erecta TaxID=1367422 RepID=A0A178Z394_9EURO|nr:hypothetical protein AYL99_11751 [Fonsecaea erecta]OAP53991.1 hypothetical protein AYL99_11751 [Fonsecaea erecta]
MRNTKLTACGNPHNAFSTRPDVEITGRIEPIRKRPTGNSVRPVVLTNRPPGKATVRTDLKAIRRIDLDIRIKAGTGIGTRTVTDIRTVIDIKIVIVIKTVSGHTSWNNRTKTNLRIRMTLHRTKSSIA